MANAAKKENGEGAGISGEYKKPDMERAFEIYDERIAPKKAHISTLTGDLKDPWATIKDDCHAPRKVMNFITSIEDEEEAKRDHILLALAEGLRVRKLFLPRDLVTIANGEEGGPVIPSGDRAKPKLATLGGKPADEPAPGTGAAALKAMNEANAGDKADDFEASPEELAQQEGRPDRSEGEEEEAPAEAAE